MEQKPLSVCCLILTDFPYGGRPKPGAIIVIKNIGSHVFPFRIERAFGMVGLTYARDGTVLTLSIVRERDGLVVWTESKPIEGAVYEKETGFVPIDLSGAEIHEEGRYTLRLSIGGTERAVCAFGVWKE